MLYERKRLILTIGIITGLFVLGIYIFTLKQELSTDTILVSTNNIAYDEEIESSGNLLYENSGSYFTQDNQTNPIVYASGSDEINEEAIDNLGVNNRIDFHNAKKYYKYSSKKYGYSFYLPIYSYYYASSLKDNKTEYNPDHIVTIDVESNKAKRLESASIHTAFFTYDHKEESDEYLLLFGDHDTQTLSLKNGRLFIFGYGDTGADDRVENIIQTIKESAE